MRNLLDKIDRNYAKVCLYAGATVILTLAAGMLIWYASGFVLELWLLLSAVVTPLVVGAVISYLLEPVVVRVSRWLGRRGYHPEKKSRRRRLAVIIVLAGVALIIVGFLLVLAAMVTHSLSGLSVELMQQLYDVAEGDFNELVSGIQGKLQEFGIDAKGMESVLDVASSVTGFFSTAFFSVIFAVYFLIDGDTVFPYLMRLLDATVGHEFVVHVSEFFSDADRVFSGYIRGQLLDAMTVGTITAVTLTLLGVPYGVIVGLITGVGNLIPYVGGPLGYFTLALVCLSDGQLGKLVLGVACLSVIMLLDANVINPRLLSENIEVHPLLVVAALIAGGAVGGIVGMLMAVPVAAFVKVKVDAWLDKREAHATKE